MDLSDCISRNVLLPDNSLPPLWDSLVVDKSIKDRLLNHAALALTVRSRLKFSTTALQGLIALVGPPGTGKTTLARGLAHEVAAISAGRKARLVEVNPHGLMSAEHGRSQRAVNELLVDYIPGLIEKREATVVLIDEVESMAVARSAASLSANPVDVHRATDAVLTALDHVAATHPNVLFVVTSNFLDGLDEAFLSRVDLKVELPLPDAAAVKKILAVTLEDFSEAYSKLDKLAADPRLATLAASLVGLDGRQLRKLVIASFARRRDVAMDPNKLTFDDVEATAAEFTAAARKEGSHVYTA